ncbi:MAG: SDR family oxidoreductase [Anaerolineales bacterium]
MTMKKVLITGGARGIGKAIAEKYAESGFEVHAPTRQEMDLSDENSVQDFISRHRQITFDVLVNNAGENIIGGLQKLSLADWKRMQATNITAPFLLTQFVAGQMMLQNWGRIVNISSAYSTIARTERGGYSATKAAINSLTRTAALEFAENNILVNAVAPGFLETDLTRKNNPPQQIENLRSQVPMKRLGEPCEVAELVYFLGSSSNTYITGQVIFIDGGFMAQ